MYGGYGGMGMMGGYGMGGYGMMGMGPMMGGQGPLAQSTMQMFQMTQMMELNTMFLDQLQNQISMIYYRCSQVLSWLFGVKEHFATEKYHDEVAQYPASSFNTTLIEVFASQEEKHQVLTKVRKRIRVLVGLTILFLLYGFRKRQWELKAARATKKVWLGVGR